ncbi:MAG: hypothetical protein R3D27_11250 [Hyphomicrobiaceae bacterium]
MRFSAEPVARAAAIALVGIAALGLTMTVASAAEPLAVTVENRSEPVLCAEKDNVTLALSSDRVARFRVEATHPAYLGALQKDSFAADWTACDMSKDPIFRSAVTTTTRRTLYEEPGLWVVGWTFPTYWRPSTAKVRVGGNTFEGLHLLQVWTIRPMGGEEVLVVYPQDGYWRIRPKAPEGRAPTAFGSSFLVGPVELAGRPVVRISEIAFDPVAQAFDVVFAAGGKARLKLAEMSPDRTAVDVTFESPVVGGPFAMLRSMYVTEVNNDVARVAARNAAAKGWHEGAIMEFKGGLASELWAGRTTPSRHNTSSPDMAFRGFQP